MKGSLRLRAAFRCFSQIIPLFPFRLTCTKIEKNAKSKGGVGEISVFSTPRKSDKIICAVSVFSRCVFPRFELTNIFCEFVILVLAFFVDFQTKTSKIRPMTFALPPWESIGDGIRPPS